MIRIFEGVPGSGKTYAMVHYLRRFAEWDDFYKEWILKDGVLVISNIEGLKIPHVDFGKLVDELGLKGVFSEDFIKSLWDKGYTKIIFAIDEAQRYFDRRYFDKEVFYFFQYHRHYGVDILLATQDSSTIAKEIRVLAEFIIRAEQRSLTVKSFKYKFYTPDDRTHLFNKTISKDPKVFAMYKSFHVEEVDKPPNVLIRQLVIPVFAFFLFIFGAVAYIKLYMFPSASSDISSTPSESSPSSKLTPKPKPVPSFHSSNYFRYQYSGYARLGEYYVYLTPLGFYYSSVPCLHFQGYILCSSPLRLLSPKISSPLPPPTPSQFPETHPKGGGGLVNNTSNSHTPLPSSPAIGGGL